MKHIYIWAELLSHICWSFPSRFFILNSLIQILVRLLTLVWIFTVIHKDFGNSTKHPLSNILFWSRVKNNYTAFIFFQLLMKYISFQDVTLPLTTKWVNPIPKLKLNLWIHAQIPKEIQISYWPYSINSYLRLFHCITNHVLGIHFQGIIAQLCLCNSLK